ncbi:copper amine oxidase [Penicillium capsulatum]|nr:copper amine oxidase [Penicillium capsulatum]
MVDFLYAEHNDRPLPSVPRKVFLIWYLEYTRLFEGIVDLSTNILVHHVELPRDFHGPVDRAEMNEAAQVVMKDPRAQAVPGRGP